MSTSNEASNVEEGKGAVGDIAPSPTENGGGGDLLVSKLEDHFSLDSSSCLVRSRQGRNAVRVYDPGFSQQIVIEESYESDNGIRVEVKKMKDVTSGHRLLNAYYAIVASLFAGFLFVFCLEILLFVVLHLSIAIESTQEKNTSIGNVIGAILGIVAFSHYFAEALVIAERFIIDAFADHPLARSFFHGEEKGEDGQEDKTDQNYVFIEWAFLSCFLLVPIFVGIITLLMDSDDWWFNTTISWFTLVMAFFVIFCGNVVFYEIRAGFRSQKDKENDSESFFAILKKCILLKQTNRYSGYLISTGIESDTFKGTEATECDEVAGDDGPLKESWLPIHIKVWASFTKYMSSCCFRDLPKRKSMFTIADSQDYRPFLTMNTWSLERVFCRPSPSRYIAVVKGTDALTKSQQFSSLACAMLAVVFTTLFLVGFLIWMELGIASIGVVIFFLIAWFPSLRNTYNLIYLAKDKKRKEAQTVYHVTQVERIREATNFFGWLAFLVEWTLFFLWPTISLFLLDLNLALFFLFISLVSNIRWYISIVAAIEEKGNMDFVEGEGKQKWQNKSRLNDIVTNISANTSYSIWRVLLLFLGFIFVGVLLSVSTTGVKAASGNELHYLPASDFSYPGAPQEMRYPTCTMANIEGGFGNQTKMLDFAWLAGMAYLPPVNTTDALKTWFGDETQIKDQQAVVDDFRKKRNKSSESDVQIKLVSVPGPGANETTGIILIRGTVNQWDMLADAQLWSAAVLMQWLRYILPIGELWTPIFGEIVLWMNTVVASSSLDNIAFYTLTTDLANHLKTTNQFDYLQVTGHSLGGGLSLITGAQAGIPAVGVSAPNALISGPSYKPPISAEGLNNYTFNIIPDYDIVPKTDDVADNYQPISCNADLSKSFYECHSISRSVCELMYTCGSGDRPVYCECWTQFGYPPPVAADGVDSSLDDLCKDAM